MCVSSPNEGKTQVKWAGIVRRRVWRWISANNIPPKGFPCHVQDLDEMIVRFSCLETSKNYSGNGCA
jgi:hypothetical protein